MMRTTAIGIAAAGLAALGAATYWPATTPAPALPATAATRPYAGLQDRQIKALAPERVDDLLAGRGASYALAAELNQYPGPSHVLEFAAELRLRPDQEQATRAIKGTMQQDARQLGARLVELEGELDRAFRGGGITGAELERLTAEIAATDGGLRATHLAAHLRVKEVLNPEQVARYDQLRGYAQPVQGGSSSGHEYQSDGLNRDAPQAGAAADREHAPAIASEATDMDRIPTTLSATAAGVAVELIAPQAIEPNTPTRLTYRLAEASGAPITDVVVSHEQPMHLIAVRRDLAEFQHVHPQPTGRPGEYAIELNFPTAGTYVLYDEFTRASGQDILQRDELTVGGPSGAASLAEDTAAKTVGNVRVSLHADGTPTAGHEARLIFQLAEAASGRPLSNLKPYLGAAAHVVVLTEDAGTFAHTHGEAVGAGGHHGQAAEAQGGHGGHGAAEMGIRPEIAFTHAFPAAGLYKIWGQFQTSDGQVITADFVIRVN